MHEGRLRFTETYCSFVADEYVNPLGLTNFLVFSNLRFASSLYCSAYSPSRPSNLRNPGPNVAATWPCFGGQVRNGLRSPPRPRSFVFFTVYGSPTLTYDGSLKPPSREGLSMVAWYRYMRFEGCEQRAYTLRASCLICGGSGVGLKAESEELLRSTLNHLPKTREVQTKRVKGSVLVYLYEMEFSVFIGSQQRSQ